MRIMPVVLLSLIVLFSLPSEGLAEVRSSERRDSDAAEVALRRVILFSSGVGYFSYGGEIAGDTELHISFSREEMKDVLKSFVVQDHDGGRVDILRYEAKKSLGRLRGDYRLDPSQADSIAELLAQVRGEEIVLSGAQRIRGRILAVKERVSDETKKTITEFHLVSEGSLKIVYGEEVDELRFIDGELQAELERALSLLSEERKREENRLTIRFSGEGKRRVSFGYLREMPVWKTSYRLIEQNGGYHLQGWGIVENTTDEAWRDVRLSLVAGSPVSFIMDLYSPIYNSRPVLTPPMARIESPPEYERDHYNFEESAAPAPSLAKKAERRSMAADHLQDEPGSFGVSSQAEGADMGALFAYEIAEPLSIDAHAAAMVPIVGEEVEAKALSVYTEGSGLPNPFAGIRLTNNTGLHLNAGPYTVYEKASYAGDALSGEIVPGEERLLTYAVDRSLLIDSQAGMENARRTRMSIKSGVFIYTEVERRVRSYRVTNRSAKEKRLLIEHPKSSGWKLVATRGTGNFTQGESASYYRFEAVVSPAVKAFEDYLVVEEERPRRQSVTLSSIDRGTIVYYLENFELTGELREAFVKMRRYQNEILRLSQEIAAFEKDLKEIESDQSRIRSNMQRIDRDSDLYRRYLRKFEEQEDKIEEIMTNKDGREEQLIEERRALRRYLENLDV